MSTRGVASPVTDNDAYNQGETRRALNEVHDVLVTCRLRATGDGRLFFAAVDGNERFEMEVEPRKRVILKLRGQTLLERPLTLGISRHAIELEFGLFDQQVLLAVGGRALVLYPYKRPPDAATGVLHPLAIAVRGIGVQVSALRVWRDVYYLDPQGLPLPWKADASLASDQFAALGDNQPVSIDSRNWDPSGIPRSSIRGLVYRPFWAARAAKR
jgi:hypothetical protein